MPSKWATVVPPDQVEKFRARKDAEKAEREQKAAEAESAAKAQQRQEVEDDLKAKFMANDATEEDWQRNRQRILDDYFTAQTLVVAPEPVKKRIPPPFKRRNF